MSPSLACTMNRIVTALLAASLSIPMAHAGVFSVSPVRIYMKPRDRAVAVSLVNEGDTEVALQADVNEWQQTSDGNDELRLTDDIVLAPPIIKLAPQARQVVRLALLKPADASRQLTYRLIVREVPGATAPKENMIQVPISLALSIPVFITPPSAQRSVACDALSVSAPMLSVSCTNTGTAYAQVRELLVRRGARVLARFEGGMYILPGGRKSLQMRAESVLGAGAVQMEARYDDGSTQVFNVELP